MKQLLIVFFFLCSVNVSAQDVIVKKDGSTILSKVLEVNVADIKYKKFSNLSGPTYTLSKSEIMSINYENGEKENYNEQTSSSNYDNTPTNDGLIETKPALDNIDLIKSYNGSVTFRDIKKSNKKATSCLNIYGVSTNSTLSTEDVEVAFKEATEKDPNSGLDIWFYYIVIKNKTDRTIYIDLGNCFKIFKNGTFYCYYTNTEQTTVNHGGTSGGSIGLGSVAGTLGIGGVVGQLAGGISVGGGSNHSVSTTYSQQRVISIPPHAQRNLTEEKWAKIKRDSYKKIEEAEHFNEMSTNRKKGFINSGDILYFNENDTPNSIEYILTYSFYESFIKYSAIKIKLYIRQSVGKRFWGNPFSHIYRDFENIIWDMPRGEELVK